MRLSNTAELKKLGVRTIGLFLFTATIAGIIGLVVWTVLVPMITANTVTVYDSYTTGTGDINTTKSFSAALSVKKSETFTTSEECTVREIYVQSGDEVKKGDQVGATGTSGLAPGDQVHFAMYLHGQPVIPIEWWDGHWIEDNVTAKLRRYAAETPQQ